MNIHMVEPLNNFVKLPDSRWESGWWTVDESKAKNWLAVKFIFTRSNRNRPFLEAP